MPLRVSVRDGHVSVSAGFARLADSSMARIRPPLMASHGAELANDAEVCKWAAATDGPPGGCRCSTRASLLPATFSCACITGTGD